MKMTRAPSDAQIRAALLRWTVATNKVDEMPSDATDPEYYAAVRARDAAYDALLALGERALAGKQKGAKRK